MALIRLVRRVPGVVVALLAIAAVMVVSAPARSATVPIAFGAITVKALPTVGLSDGQAVALHVQSNPSVPMYDVQVHLCQSGAGVKNGFEFDLDGPYCSPSKVSPAADTGAEQSLPAATSADLTFHVGVGTGAPWQETDAGTHTLTCGPGAPCDLVVQIAAPGANLYATVPLCFGAGCPPEPADPTAPPPAAAGSGSGSAGSDGAAAGGAQASTPKGARGQSSGAGSTSGSAAGGGAAASTPSAAAAAGAAPGASASGGSTSGDGTTALAEPAVATSVAPSIATWRIALAGLAGLLCGARIVSVIGRTRRKTTLGIA